MYFEQFFLGCLAHASYMLGSEGVAAVVDPQRDVDLYLEEADAHGLQIRYVIETHLHADFVSGHGELAARSGAEIYLGSKAGATFPHVGVKEGDQLQFGDCRLRFMETPGHTEESLCVLISDLRSSPDPFAVLTGDTLFIGDVGRPDLAGNYTSQQLAELLFRSLHDKLLTLPDNVKVYPAHGAGSLCGKNMSTDRSSTIGRERTTNYALQPMSRDEFVGMLTTDLPERPGYFSRDVEINRTGASLISDLRSPAAFDSWTLLELQRHGAIVLDTRPTNEFAARHIPGSINIALSGQYALWAGSILGLDVDLVLVATDSARAAEAHLRLARVGIERVVGYLDGGIEEWSTVDVPLRSFEQIEPCELQCLLGENSEGIQVLDVRRNSEWRDGHLREAVSRPLDRLLPLPEELDAGWPIVVYCKSGYRSAIAASLLERAGFTRIVNLSGGFDAWRAANLPILTAQTSIVSTDITAQDSLPLKQQKS